MLDAVFFGIGVASEDDEPAMIPGAIVADVEFEEAVDDGNFFVPDAEAADEPLAVGPDVVVFGVFAEDFVEEGGFRGRELIDLGHDDLTMVPERGH